MVAEWGAAVLTAGAVGLAGAGIVMVWKVAPAAQRMKRRINHERVNISLLGKERTEQLSRMFPAMLGAVLLYLLISALTHRSLLAFFVALGGFMSPVWLREWQDTRRLVQLADQLGRAMSMISTSLRRGTPLEAAIAEVAGSLSAPLGPILKHMADATVLGVTLAQASEQVRTLPAVAGSTDFQVFATEVVICHERGANVVQAFEALQQVLAARRKYRDQVREQMGQHLIQSLVITAVGAFVLLAYALMTEDGLEPLLASPVGQILLAISILGNVFLIRSTHLSMLRQTKKV